MREGRLIMTEDKGPVQEKGSLSRSETVPLSPASQQSTMGGITKNLPTGDELDIRYRLLCGD